MKITEDAQFRAALLKHIADREFSERTGTHCSDLIYCLNKQALRRRLGDESTDQEVLLFSIGWATQRWLTGRDEDVESREVDGILVTCDANYYDICPVDSDAKQIYLIPFELKCTYQGSNKAIEENPQWLKQIMAQCHVMGTTVAYLSRFELMGNWKSVFGKKEEKNLPENARPTLHAYRLEFTPEELERNWQWLRERKELFEHILETGDLLPKAVAVPSGQSYECGWCKFKGVECTV